MHARFSRGRVMKIVGIHDEEGQGIVPDGGWCLALIALSESPSPRHYPERLNWLVRANWGYGSTGTIPIQSETNKYLTALGNYAVKSSGVHGYIIGNESNHEAERPNGVYITPEHYADTFVRSYETLKKVSTQNRAIVAAPAPYHADPRPWTRYWTEVLRLIGDRVTPDGLAFHAYTRSMRPESVTDVTRMGAPLEDTFSGFLVYRDFLRLIPPDMRHLPTYITEFNVLPEWEDANTGVIAAAYSEIQWWNARNDTQKIHCLLPYRWKHDRWAIEPRKVLQQDLLASFSNNVEGSRSLDLELYVPSVKKDAKASPSPSTAFERQIDERATRRGVSIVESAEAVWKVKSVRWYDEGEADRVGPDHHILLDALDEQGNRVVGVKFRVIWPTGFTHVVTESKLGERWSANFPMSASRNEFSVMVDDGGSEMVRGIGMGMDTPGGFNAGIHTSTEIVFQRSSGGMAKPVEPKTVIDLPGGRETVQPLVHPVQDPQYRSVTQGWGLRPEFYSRYKVDGVPLKGHNGLDFGTPVGSQIVAVANGRVVEVANDPEGYGLYVKLVHEWGESLYAHLDQQLVRVGDSVVAGQLLGKSGTTGNSSGPHLHFGMRVSPFRRTDGWGGYTDPSPYLAAKTDVMGAIRTAAQEAGLEWELLASIAWAESSFRPHLQYGLFQVEDGAWGDFASSVGAKNRNDALDNARVAAAYLRFLLAYFQNNLEVALTAYNFGMGNVIDKKPVPALTLTYVNKVIHGRDLLKAVRA